MGTIKRAAQGVVNGVWSAAHRKPARTARRVHPYTNYRFKAGENSRLVYGWTTQSQGINYYLEMYLAALIARSREQARNNPYGKRFVGLIKTNVIGADGVIVRPQVRRPNGELDGLANETLAEAFQDFSQFHADADGRMSLVDMDQQAMHTCCTDGGFLWERVTGPGLKYGVAYRPLDPLHLDIGRNRKEKNGNITILGVEFDGRRAVRYHFRESKQFGAHYETESRTILVDQVIHGFIPEWVGQVRGIPWMQASLVKLKELDAYDEAAMTAARVGAAKMGFIKTPSGDGYSGEDEDGDGNIITEAEPGHFEQISEDAEFQAWDPAYPHEQYGPFKKDGLRQVASGWNVSYNTLANDLEGVNFSSMRAGTLEDREVYKSLQNWFIRCNRRQVYDDFIRYGIPAGGIQIMGAEPRRPVEVYKVAAYQPKRWSWVDPAKDQAANSKAIKDGTKSPQMIIREQGNDPDDVIAERTEWKKKTAHLNEGNSNAETAD